ncbi:hypothetical protein RAS1_35640 [Phycisphaerae bacterium RAS1]|nr:hypothetical protein RAS1_35640 [Phycisphaerae bacterium RAS1]
MAAQRNSRDADPRHVLGAQGEALAESHLRNLGYKLLARRFSTPVGEIDLVMRDAGAIVFVEVKSLRSDRWSDPESRVTPAKQRKLQSAAEWYLNRHRLAARAVRFDVVAAVIPENGDPQIVHFPDAF